MPNKAEPDKDRGEPIRLVMVVTGFPGTERRDNGIFNARAAKALSRLMRVTVVHLRTWKPGRPVLQRSLYEDVPVFTLAIPQFPSLASLNLVAYRLAGWRALRAVLKSCEVIHSVGAEFAGPVASSWAKRAGAHHTVQLTGGEINAVMPRQLPRTPKWERQVHGVVSNSRASASVFLREHPESVNVRTIYRGVDLDRYHPSGPTEGPLAGYSAGRFLFLGGFPSYPSLPSGANTKGGETLLQAWKTAEDQLAVAGASLLIAGPDAQGGRVADWRRTLRHPDRVHAAGLLSPDSVPAYLRACDVVLIPSMQEGLPNVAMEAGACGRAVLASDVGGISEVVLHGETGLLLPPGDSQSWSAVLTESARKAEEMRAMGNRARARMESLFDSRAYAAQMVAFFEAALREPIIRGR